MSHSQKNLDLFKLQVKEIKALVEGQWTSVLAAIVPEIGDAAKGFTGAKRPSCGCPFHASKSKTSFRFLKSGDDNGASACFTCGTWKDGFELIMHAHSCSFSDAVRKVGYELGYDFNKAKEDQIAFEQRMKEQEVKRQAERERKAAEQYKLDVVERDKQLEALRKLWFESFSLDATEAEPARKYFKNRGLGEVGTLRGEVVFNRSVPLYNESGEFVGNFGCLLSQVRNPQGYPIRIHRTYITNDGRKVEVDGESAKKLTRDIPLVPLTGAAIQLSPAGTQVLGVGEGLETILAAMIGTKMPVNCCLNAQLLSSWLPAKGTEYVYIWADKDVSRTGELRANELQERLAELGIPSEILLPPLEIPVGESGVDWADAYNQLGMKAFPTHVLEWYKRLLPR